MKTELVLVYGDTPRTGHICALVRQQENEQEKPTYKTIVLISNDNKTAFMIQPSREFVINFSSRRTAVSSFHFIGNKAVLDKDFKAFSHDGLNYAPAAARTKIFVGNGKEKFVFRTDDVDAGWVVPSELEYFASTELMLPTTAKGFPRSYLIKLTPGTLVTMDCHLHDFLYYHTNAFATREFYVGRSIYVRNDGQQYVETGGYDPSPDTMAKIKERHPRLSECLRSLGL